MAVKIPEYTFLSEAGKLINTGISRSLILSGNIHDLFLNINNVNDNERKNSLSSEYLSLVPFLCQKWDIDGFILVVYELNGPIRFLSDVSKDKVRKAYDKWKHSINGRENLLPENKPKFEEYLHNAIGNPTVALEFLRQLCLLSRSEDSRPFLEENLLILVEAADLLLPEGEISRLSVPDRHRINIVQDWFLDPTFVNAKDAVVFIAESKSLLNSQISRLPQVISVEIPAPDMIARQHFISWFNQKQNAAGSSLSLWGTQEQLATLTAGLTLHALRQLLMLACYQTTKLNQKLEPSTVVHKVSDFIQSQLGEDVVEFKKPNHSLEDVIGNRKLLNFLREKLIPRLKSTGDDAIVGAAVGGPIGCGKTFIFEGLAGDLDMPVIVLKNIRSQWFGQTDVIFERLRRLLMALDKAMIFVDEADTQFGGIDKNAHATERRLTGKIQAMMSDPQLKGRVAWLLMTARIHNLSPDLRREGRVGDLIIPVLDPEGKDREAFIRWSVSSVYKKKISADVVNQLKIITAEYSAASYASLRSDLQAEGNELSLDQVIQVAEDRILPNVGIIRRYQTLQALINCTRKSLLPQYYSPQLRVEWKTEIQHLEQSGQLN
ncbi:hypothetical protein CMK18_01975 [Candidatus Poribacteria bacterium]|nr:hypothetical protein [Candidatus Poribacteria bacterium]